MPSMCLIAWSSEELAECITKGNEKACTGVAGQLQLLDAYKDVSVAKGFQDFLTHLLFVQSLRISDGDISFCCSFKEHVLIYIITKNVH